jgi:hypothetical protein
LIDPPFIPPPPAPNLFDNQDLSAKIRTDPGNLKPKKYDSCPNSEKEAKVIIQKPSGGRSVESGAWLHNILPRFRPLPGGNVRRQRDVYWRKLQCLDRENRIHGFAALDCEAQRL